MFDLTSRPLDVRDLTGRLVQPASGALVTFEGRVRNQNRGRRVVALEYQAYDKLARKEGTRIVEEVREEYPVHECLCVHRTGRLEIEEAAVWIGVSAGHRRAGFETCRHLIDEVKARVPIWKKEFYADGTSRWIEGS